MLTEIPNLHNSDYAIVAVENTGLYNIINKQGECILDRNYRNIKMITPNVYSMHDGGYMYHTEIQMFGQPNIHIYSTKLGDFLDGTFNEIIIEKNRIKYIRRTINNGNQNHKYCYSDLDGCNQTELLYLTTNMHFSCGLARIRARAFPREKSKPHFIYGFVDETGRVVIPLKFDSASAFINNLSVVKQDNQWGFIDTTGNFTTPYRYDYLSRLGSNHYAFQLKGLYGVLDMNTNVIIPNQYCFVNLLRDNMFIAQRQNKSYCIVNDKGKEEDFNHVAQLDIARIYHTDSGEHLIIGANSDNKMGVINAEGNTIISFSYDNITPTNDGSKNDGFKLENLHNPYQYWLVDFNNNTLESSGDSEYTDKDNDMYSGDDHSEDNDDYAGFSRNEVDAGIADAFENDYDAYQSWKN